MSWLYIALLALAIAVVVGAEWPRIGERVGVETRRRGASAQRRKPRAKKKPNLRLVQDDDADDFAASVERDLANLPTIDETERR